MRKINEALGRLRDSYNAGLADDGDYSDNDKRYSGDSDSSSDRGSGSSYGSEGASRASQDAGTKARMEAQSRGLTREQASRAGDKAASEAARASRDGKSKEAAIEEALESARAFIGGAVNKAKAVKPSLWRQKLAKAATPITNMVIGPASLALGPLGPIAMNAATGGLQAAAAAADLRATVKKQTAAFNKELGADESSEKPYSGPGYSGGGSTSDRPAIQASNINGPITRPTVGMTRDRSDGNKLQGVNNLIVRDDRSGFGKLGYTDVRPRIGITELRTVKTNSAGQSVTTSTAGQAATQPQPVYQAAPAPEIPLPLYFLPLLFLL